MQRSAVQSDIVFERGWAFVWGVAPVDLHDDRVPLPEYVEAQTQQVFANLEALLAGSGLTKRDIVGVRVSLANYERLFDRMNAAYAAYFDGLRLPARSCVGVAALTRGASVEMDFTLRAPDAA